MIVCVIVCACRCVTDKPFHILFTSVSHIPLTRIRPPETLAVTSAEHHDDHDDHDDDDDDDDDDDNDDDADDR